MNLANLLSKHHISQGALCRGAELSRSVASRIVTHGEWPRRDPDAPARIADFLAQNGVDRDSLENLFPQQKKAPDVQQHAEAVPEASLDEETQEESMILRFTQLTPQAKQHFGLPRSPFVNELQVLDDVFASGNTRYVRAALLDAARNHGFVAIHGESGAGKSTLVEELEERIRVEERPIIVIRPYILGMEADDKKGKTLKGGQISEAIIRTLDPSATPKRSPEARDNQVEGLLKSSREAGYSHLLLIEEAHAMPKPTLRHLKRFLEIKQGLGRRLLGVCLVGQPELLMLLSDKSLDVREVVQRCETIELLPLDNDLESYLKHKFERVGVKLDDVLAPNACDEMRAKMVTQSSRYGSESQKVSLCYPLAVNNLLTRAMNQAAAVGWPKVDAQTIAAVWK